MKRFIVTYHSRYFRYDVSRRILNAPSQKWIRNNWHSIMLTDEYVIEKIVEMTA